jgi:hypothetical protein
MERMPLVGRDVATSRDLVSLEKMMDLRFQAFAFKFEALEHKMVADRLATDITAQYDLISRRTKALVALILSSLWLTAAVVFGITKLA